MIRMWKAVLLVNLALGVGLGVGYVWWGREGRDLRAELAAARGATQAGQGARSLWTVKGIVRSVLADLGAVVITHEAIPGLMGGMTMGFEAEDPKLLAGLAPGDPVEFTVVRKSDRLVLVAIERSP